MMLDILTEALHEPTRKPVFLGLQKYRPVRRQSGAAEIAYAKSA
jgi:hypothetical protein